jgi:hypothetical protein
MSRLALLILFVGSLGLAHEGGKDNCRVTLQSYFTNGKRKVDVAEIHVDSHEQCRGEAMRRKLSSESSDDEALYKVNVIFAYRELAISQ